ncbi:hypothetical protein [Arenimonas fontis]|uniref:DUF2884 family protein n=1 Tax=Arenimonas fontis TaxID=2608255 RepID=A0A5B2ZFU8_9GAMM|nr:hypothetical protein [Arenimonas fontis]KAA2286120.1 hypothetical protein F0415_01045 [Arenimonas fontis]
MKHAARGFALLMLLPLAGCGLEGAQDRAEDVARRLESAAERVEARTSEIAERVRRDVAGSNLRLGGGADALPRAEITPEGELLIDGKPLGLGPEQRGLALAYRNEVIGVASAGAEIGVEGAALATRALGEAASALLSGDTAGIDARIEAEAERIRASASALCDRLPALRQARDALASAVPEFAPYAEMELTDINNCNKEI